MTKAGMWRSRSPLRYTVGVGQADNIGTVLFASFRPAAEGEVWLSGQLNAGPDPRPLGNTVCNHGAEDCGTADQ